MQKKLNATNMNQNMQKHMNNLERKRIQYIIAQKNKQENVI